MFRRPGELLEIVVDVKERPKGISNADWGKKIEKEGRKEYYKGINECKLRCNGEIMMKSLH